jgi:hypothetical protein
MWAADITTTLNRDKGSYAESLALVRTAALGFVPEAEIARILGGTVSEWFGWPV